jgi:Domain of unknown function (DUF2019)
MKRAKLQDMAMNQLVERFTAIGIEQDQALLRRQHPRFNCMFDEMATTSASCHGVSPVGFDRRS